MEIALDRQAVARRGKRLEHFTIAWNSLEGLVALVAGALAGSISLVGFGIDSFIEVTSGTVLPVRGCQLTRTYEGENANEQLSLRIVGVCFLALAAYVGYESISDLISKKAPEHSIPESSWPVFRLVGNATALSGKEESGKRTWKCSHARRCQADRFLRLLVRHSVDRAASQRRRGVVVG
jgi:divalent metal cation (Fe/Co/Zn/Cd) transporter